MSVDIAEEQQKIVNLFRSVIVLAYKDYCGKDKLKADAVGSWLSTQDFRTVCDMANADPDTVHHHISTKSKEFKDILRLFTDSTKTVNNNRK